MSIGRPDRGWSADFELPILAVDDSVLPSWGYGLGVGAGVRIRHVQLKLSGRLWLPPDRRANAGAYTVRYVSRYTGELSGCYGVPHGPFEIGPCLLLRLENVTASATGPEVTPASRSTQWLAVGLAVRARWSLVPWAALFARPSLAFATSRPSFVIDGVNPPIDRAPVAAVALDLGCEWIL